MSCVAETGSRCPAVVGLTLVLFAVLLVFVIAMVAFAVDIGFLCYRDAGCRTRPTRRRWPRRRNWTSIPTTSIAVRAAAVAAAQSVANENLGDDAKYFNELPGPRVRANGVRRLEVQL